MAKRSEWKLRAKPQYNLPVEYGALSLSGKGTLLNLSEEGLMIRGTHPVHTGLKLMIKISPKDDTAPLQIPRAHVRWVKGQEFGVRFDPLDPAVRAQLVALITSLAPPAPERKIVL